MSIQELLNDALDYAEDNNITELITDLSDIEMMIEYNENVYTIKSKLSETINKADALNAYAIGDFLFEIINEL